MTACAEFLSLRLDFAIFIFYIVCCLLPGFFFASVFASDVFRSCCWILFFCLEFFFGSRVPFLCWTIHRCIAKSCAIVSIGEECSDPILPSKRNRQKKNKVTVWGHEQLKDGQQILWFACEIETSIQKVSAVLARKCFFWSDVVWIALWKICLWIVVEGTFVFCKDSCFYVKKMKFKEHIF